MDDVTRPGLKDIPTAAPGTRDLDSPGGTKRQGSKKHGLLLWLATVLTLVVVATATAWALFFRPIGAQVSHSETNVAVRVFGLGTVEARVTSKVGFKVSGVLVDLKADVGDRVPKAAVLARLDDREQSARVARTRATIEQAKANLQRATASVEKAQANY